MSLNFPSSPTEGDTHYDEGNLWTYSGGAWVVGSGESAITRIAESNLASQYQVWGDMLIQWGSTTSQTPTRNITFPIQFQEEPHVTVTPEYSGSGSSISAQPDRIRAQDFRFYVVNLLTDNAIGGEAVHWMAVGEAPDALKKPKEVATSIGNYEAFHDPTGTASYRIVGDTLECWGNVTTNGSGAASITLPKTYTGVPSATLIANSGALTLSQATGLTTTQLDVYTADANNLGTARPVSWHTIGQWDGVS